MQKHLAIKLAVAGLLLFILSGPATATGNQYPAGTDRNPAVAGSFYPAGKAELREMLDGFFRNSPAKLPETPLALIVPHAGYVFSGNVAAAGFRQVSRDASFRHVFIIGSSHTAWFDGACIFTGGDFITPLGRVKTDTLAQWLAGRNRIFNTDPKPHEREHSIEVQLPFLQYWLKKPFTIVPILLGGESPATCRKLASALEPFLNRDNLFIISTDFSHYPRYDDAVFSDSLMAGAVLANSPSELLRVKQKVERKGLTELVTPMCGWTSVLTLLDMTANKTNLAWSTVMHGNSGDSRYGEKNRVVGYRAMALSWKQEPEPGSFTLTSEEKRTLLMIARKTIREWVSRNRLTPVDPGLLTPALQTPAGAFVTLTENGRLRGCIGSFQASEPLYKTVQSMAVESSTRDSRFDPVSASDVERLKIEISVLSPMKRIRSISEIKLGKHGIYIRKGINSGTFLPQVATDTGWNLEDFLGHCARDKAGIGWNGWKDAEIFTYEALVFGEEDEK